MRKNVFFTVACFARQCGAGLIIIEAAAELFYTRESRKRRVNGRGQRRRKTTFMLMTRDVVFLLLFPSPLHPLLSSNKNSLFQTFSRHRARERSMASLKFNSLGLFGAGEHIGEDEIDAEELDDLENDDITEEETKSGS